MTGNTFLQLQRAQKCEGRCQGAKLWQGGDDSGALTKNRWAEFHKTSGGGRGRLEAMGDQRNERFGAHNPEVGGEADYQAMQPPHGGLQM
ncbi:hypothetical protein PISMIDRAFT_684647 [Pisolithus microcarpus 441]|uniref:Uncharacterized protein n=1 Tax=Pisolithus microcarpus 441 TaxID=765257 RepID=A0A0C9YML6_9AGAM|nr:hypothetical protein PISMIDRAFT_684647 [Pisolithus microcarpus 441]